MSVVYMRSSKGEVLALDATVNVTKSRNNTLTKSSVQSGAQISDGFTIGNPSITFSGVCSYTKIKRTGEEAPPTPDKLNVILDEMILSKERFTLYGNNLIPTLSDVVILSYSLVQSIYENAIDVTITVEQVFISKSAQKTRITAPAKSTNGDVTEEEGLGQGNKTQQPEAQKISYLQSLRNEGLF